MVVARGRRALSSHRVLLPLPLHLHLEQPEGKKPLMKTGMQMVSVTCKNSNKNEIIVDAHGIFVDVHATLVLSLVFFQMKFPRFTHGPKY